MNANNKTLRLIGLIAACAIGTLQAQDQPAQDNNAVDVQPAPISAPVVEAEPPTPAPGPTIRAGFQTVVDAIKSGQTNWYLEAHGLYAPALPKKYGFGLGVFYPLSDIVVTGIRIDYVDGGFYMPSGNAGLQLPLQIFPWLKISPFTYAGIGVPLSGAKVGDFTVPGRARDNNGQPTTILGYGVGISLFQRKTPATEWYQPDSLDIVADRETWSGFSGKQYRFGILFHKKF